jgi:LacI family transcriptional regulator
MTEHHRNSVPPTISQVAQAAGVGRATVARTLGGYGSVSAATRDRVMRAAKELGYRPNAVARSMTTGETKTLGLVLADVGNPYFAGVLKAFTDTVHKHGYDVLVLSTEEDLAKEADAVGVLVDKQVDGLVLASAASRNAPPPHLELVRARGIPMVLVDRLFDSVDIDTVVINNREAAREAVSELIGSGHRRIGFVWGPVTVEPATSLPEMDEVIARSLSSDGERLRGYLDALEKAGIDFDTSLVTHVLKNEHQATRAVIGMLSLADPPTAIFATESDALVGAIRALRQMGLSYPEDVSLIGFDDSSWATIMSPPLSMVSQPLEQLGRLTADCLLERIKGTTASSTTHVLEATFMPRASVAKPRGR